jgi:hypothetical protein
MDDPLLTQDGTCCSFRAVFRSFLQSASLATLMFASLGAAKADVVWSQDFTGHADNAFPFNDFTGNTTNDWSAINDETKFRVSTLVGNPSPALVFTDATTSSTNGLGNLQLAMSQFAPFSTATASTPVLHVAFDWKIENFLSGATTEAFRFVLRANGSMTLGDQLIIGFNRANLADGDASSSDLALYAATNSGTSNIVATDSNAIGLISGTGWQPGFNFGEYDSVNGEANDTDDLFYRFTMDYNFTTGLLSGSVTRLALDATNGQSADFSVAMNPGLVFSNQGTLDVLLFASTNGVTGVSQLDNIVFESVPEPASGMAILLGVGAIAARRRRLP